MDRKKWLSRRWWVCVWAMVMLSVSYVLSSIGFIPPEWFNTAAPILVGLIGGWMASETFTKPKGGA